jgi:hypothetical protein
VGVTPGTERARLQLLCVRVIDPTVSVTVWVPCWSPVFWISAEIPTIVPFVTVVLAGARFDTWKFGGASTVRLPVSESFAVPISWV